MQRLVASFCRAVHDAAVLEPMGMLVIIDEVFSGNDWRAAGMLVAGTMALQQLLTLSRVPRTSLVFLALAFMSAE